MRKALLNTCKNDFHTDQKYSILHGGLLAASELNKGQTLFQDMCDRLQRGEYGQQSELALIACKYNLEIIVFENGTQQWIQKPTGTHQQKHVIALRWCRDSIHYDWLKQINSDEPKRVTPLPVSSKLGPNFTDANNSPLPTSQESNRSRQLKKKFSHCLNFMDAVEVDPTTTSAKCNRILHQPGSSAVGLNLKDTDNLSPSTPKDSYRTRQSKKNSSRCSIVGINGKIDPLSEYDEVDEEVIYSQESPNMEEFYRDFDWELDRFVEYRLPIKKPL